MASKRRLSTSPSPEPVNNDTTETQLEDPSNASLCLICGDKARIINYGALSCQSCKTFFRRNGYRPESVRPCIFNKCCEVNMLTRHNCTACRLVKCFAMGMTSNLIRKEDFKKPKNSSSTQSNDTEQLTTAPQPLVLDHLQNDRSILIDSEWALISNVLYAYDTYNTVSQVCHTIDNLSTLPDEAHLHVISPLEIVSAMFTSVQTFISSLPDFQILTINEQISLFERNIHGIIGFYSTFFFRSTGIFHNVKYMEAFTTVYGSNAMLLSKHANDHLDPDSTLIKIIIIVFAFSSNCFIVNTNENIERDSLLYGTFRLLGSQNVYLELLWKYMVYRYGYNASILRFARLIQSFLCVLKNLEVVQTNNEAHQNMVADVFVKTKQSLNVSGYEQTPLWGKI